MKAINVPSRFTILTVPMQRRIEIQTEGISILMDKHKFNALKMNVKILLLCFYSLQTATTQPSHDEKCKRM